MYKGLGKEPAFFKNSLFPQVAENFWIDRELIPWLQATNSSLHRGNVEIFIFVYFPKGASGPLLSQGAMK